MGAFQNEEKGRRDFLMYSYSIMLFSLSESLRFTLQYYLTAS